MVMVIDGSAKIREHFEHVGVIYRLELDRTIPILLRFMVELLSSGSLVRSGHTALHGALIRLTRYLLNAGDRVALAAELLEVLQTVLHAAGLFGMEAALEALVPPIAESEADRVSGRRNGEERPRSPTDVPFTEADAQELNLAHARLRSSIANAPAALARCFESAVTFRDDCRRRLGPLHSTTMYAQLDMSLVLVRMGRLAEATNLALDTEDTAEYYFGCRSPVTLLVQECCLPILERSAGPTAARHFFNTRLRWLALADEEALSPELRAIRRSPVLRQFLTDGPT